MLRGSHGGRTGAIVVYVDADACPVKQEIHFIAGRHERKVVLVANTFLYVPAPFTAEMVVVSEGLDAADDWIAEHVQEGDVVVTADIPLAARCLDKGARVLGPQGREFTQDSIGNALASRDINAFLRETGGPVSGPPPFSDAARSRFRAKFNELLQARG